MPLSQAQSSSSLSEAPPRELTSQRIFELEQTHLTTQFLAPPLQVVLYDSLKEALSAELLKVIGPVIHRVHSWRIPANWSKDDWFAEMESQVLSALWQALRDYDVSRNVPLAAFIYSRAIASALSRYRQEWSYAFHCRLHTGRQGLAGLSDTSPNQRTVHDIVLFGLAELAKSESQLMLQLFLEGYTEQEVAQRLGISHQAVSKRKKVLLQNVRKRLAV